MRSIARRLSIFAIPFSLVAVNATAYASDSDTMNVSASVDASCTISVTTDLAFGAYDTIVADAKAGEATLTVACSASEDPYIVTLSQGANPETLSTASTPLRQMLGATSSDMLTYKLYQTEGGAVWGDDAGSGVSYLATSAAASGLTVWGEIDAGQDVPVDSYTDTVLATITF